LPLRIRADNSRSSCGFCCALEFGIIAHANPRYSGDEDASANDVE
jgi:hypothetical protein